MFAFKEDTIYLVKNVLVATSKSLAAEGLTGFTTSPALPHQVS